MIHREILSLYALVWILFLFLSRIGRVSCVRPVIRIVDGIIGADGTVNVVNAQSIEVMCSAEGPAKEIQYLQLQCGGFIPVKETQDSDISQSYFIDLSMNGRNCSCLVKDSSQQELTTQIAINFITSPQFESYEKKGDFSLVMGDVLISRLKINAIPKVHGYTLTKNGKVADQTFYSVETVPVEGEPDRYWVVFKVPDLYPHDSGDYSLAMDNGIEDALNYSFKLQVSEEKTSPKEEESGGSYFYWIALFSVVGLFILIAAKQTLKEKRDSLEVDLNMEDVGDDDDLDKEAIGDEVTTVDEFDQNKEVASPGSSDHSHSEDVNDKSDTQQSSSVQEDELGP